MNTWPNWVDLIIIIVVLRSSYNGFGRGLFAEILNLLGALTITALTVNYAGLLTRVVQPMVWFNPMVTGFLVFWLLFLICLLAVHLLLRRVTEVIKWERVHWVLQGSGLVLGGLRGLWWAGFIVLTLTSSGFVYLRESVEDRSVLGPNVMETAQRYMKHVIDQFPGARYQGETLIPPIKPTSRANSTQ